MSKFIIEGGSSLNGEISPSGNKNEVLPALMTCLLTKEAITLNRVPQIEDVKSVCSILKKLGVDIQWLGPQTLRMESGHLSYKKPDFELCSLVRASILLLGPLLARFQKVELPMPGGDVIGARRIDTHFEAIESLGAQMSFENEFIGHAKKLQGNDIFLDEPSVTATENILMLAVLCPGKTTIHNAACEPHVIGLSKLLQKMGAKIDGIGSNKICIEGVSELKGAKHDIGPDFMEVGSLLCLSAITEGDIKITNVEESDLRFILKTFERIGIHVKAENNVLLVDKAHDLTIRSDLGSKIPTVYSGPWPAFPTDLMSVAIVAATQAKGSIIMHEKMFEGRMFFTDKLMDMGANIVLCDPHRIVINGPAKLRPARLSSPDVRAGMAMLMAALVAEGKSEIHNIYQIDRGYDNIDKKLISLGAKITRLD